MIRSSRVMTVLTALTLGGAAVASAQRPIELGMDGGLRLDLESPRTTVIALPVQGLRVGFFLSDNISFEPAVAFNWIKTSGEDSFSTLGLDAALLYHFSTDASANQVFVRPVAGLSRISGAGESVNQFQVGAGLGVKLPIADRLKLRLEGNLRHGLESDDVASGTLLGLLVGFSFMTR